jgi:PadR family transcriptional regulator, regulatory protein PadR
VDTSQLLKGVLDLAVLAVLDRADGYGYEVVRGLRAAGLEEVGDASVYGTLRRLYNAGLRKYYSLNDRGRERLGEQTKLWQSFADTMKGLVGAR